MARALLVRILLHFGHGRLFPQSAPHNARCVAVIYFAGILLLFFSSLLPSWSCPARGRGRCANCSLLVFDKRPRAQTAENFLETNGLHRACGNSSGAQDCPTNYICLQGNGSNPNHGYTSFDSIQRSLLTVFRIVQRDFWEETMQYLLAAVGPWHILLFIALIYIVSYQLCTLLFAPIALAYNYLRVEQWEHDLLSDLNKVS